MFTTYAIKPPEDLAHRSEPIRTFWSVFEGDHVFDWHWHQEFELTYVKSGSGTYGLDFEWADVEAGDLVIMGSRTLHCVTPNGGYFEGQTVTFDPSSFQSICSDSADVKYIAPLAKNHMTICHVVKNITARGPHIPQIFDQLIELHASKSPAYLLALKGLVFQVLAMLYAGGYLVATDDGHIPHRRSVDAIKTVLHHMDTHCGQKIYLQQLADLVNYDASYLTRLFKKTLGHSCIEMLTRIRMQKALELLQNTDLSMTQIALETGFADLSFFQRQFKRYYGSTPMQWRREHALL